MIEGIYQIGEIVKKGNRISFIASSIPNTKKKNKNYKIAKVNFDTENDVIEIDMNEEYEPGKEREYKFVQLFLSGRQNQFSATFSDPKSRLVIKEKDRNKKYASWLSIEDELKNLPPTEEITNFLTQMKKVKNKFYPHGFLEIGKIKEIDSLDFDKFVKSKLSKNEAIIFWTVLVDGKKIVDYEFYEALLKYKILEAKKKKGKIRCFMCNREVEEYIDDFARLPIKFFINDKIGFSQGLSGKWEGNFALCKDCYFSLYAGQKFIQNNFSFKVGNLSYIIVPEFPKEVSFELTKEKFENWASLVKDVYNVFSFLDIQQLSKRLEEYKEYGYLPYFWLNYIFFEQNNQQFKIYSLIKDIPKGRIDFLLDKLLEYKDTIYQNLPEFLTYMLKNYQTIYQMIPLRYSTKDGKILENPKITELFSQILEGRNIKREFLISEFWLGTKAKYFRNRSYHNVKDTDNTEGEIVKYLLMSHQLLILFRKLNLLEGGGMSIENLPPEIKRYIEEVGFSEKEVALFLLGTLMGDIGSKQVKYGNKPILNKVNFQGMSLEKIKILFNEIYEKLIQEKMFHPDQESIYALAHKLLDKNMNTWTLKPYENVYYLLSGYAFKTALNIEKSRQREGTDE